MVRKKIVKRVSTPRPYNCWTLSESELRTKLINKIRQFSQYWLPAKRVKTNTKACAECWAVVSKYDADHIQSCVPIEGWKKTDDLFLWYNWNEYFRNIFVEIEGYQGLCSDCHKSKTKADNAERKRIKNLTTK